MKAAAVGSKAELSALPDLALGWVSGWASVASASSSSEPGCSLLGPTTTGSRGRETLRLLVHTPD